jgi:hypothetical protein
MGNKLQIKIHAHVFTHDKTLGLRSLLELVLCLALPCVSPYSGKAKFVEFPFENQNGLP